MSTWSCVISDQAMLVKVIKIINGGLVGLITHSGGIV